VDALAHDHADILDERDAVGLQHHRGGHGNDFALGGDDFVDLAHNGPDDEHAEHAGQGKEGPAGAQGRRGALQQDAVGLEAQNVARHLALLLGLLGLIRCRGGACRRGVACRDGQRQRRGRRGPEAGGQQRKAARPQKGKEGRQAHSTPC
jgi:hypothetical protein